MPSSVTDAAAADQLSLVGMLPITIVVAVTDTFSTSMRIHAVKHVTGFIAAV